MTCPKWTDQIMCWWNVIPSPQSWQPIFQAERNNDLGLCEKNNYSQIGINKGSEADTIDAILLRLPVHGRLINTYFAYWNTKNPSTRKYFQTWVQISTIPCSVRKESEGTLQNVKQSVIWRWQLKFCKVLTHCSKCVYNHNLNMITEILQGVPPLISICPLVQQNSLLVPINWSTFLSVDCHWIRGDDYYLSLFIFYPLKKECSLQNNYRYKNCGILYNPNVGLFWTPPGKGGNI